MPGAGRVGRDIAGGPIIGPGSPNVFVNGFPASVLGDKILPHGKSPHKKSRIVSGSSSVFINGKPATVQFMSVGSCLHPVSTGSATVVIGR